MLTTWLRNAAGEIDLSETSIAAIWKIRPFIGGRLLRMLWRLPQAFAIRTDRYR
jgi:hypothetical protein